MENTKLNAYQVNVNGLLVVNGYTTIYAEDNEAARLIAATMLDHDYKCEEILDAEHDCLSEDWQEVSLRVCDKHGQEQKMRLTEQDCIELRELIEKINKEIKDEEEKVREKPVVNRAL